jgi:hypothetical protein
MEDVQALEPARVMPDGQEINVIKVYYKCHKGNFIFIINLFC